MPSRTWIGNQIYLLCALFAHNLTRKLQMIADPPSRSTSEKRPALGVHTIRYLETTYHSTRRPIDQTQQSSDPQYPRIADIGCGAGAGTLILAEKYHSKVKAVDFSREFLDELMHRARHKGLESLVEAIECDMASLDWESGTIDLLWSEGAAYNITFEGALKVWRPLMTVNGIAVITEMNYLSNDVPEIVTQYMKNAYPGIKTESKNVDLINSSGFEVFGVHRLPSKAWWDNYYDPLRENIRALKNSNDNVMQAVISETEEEMEFFKEHEKDYGYTFYIMRAI